MCFKAPCILFLGEISQAKHVIGTGPVSYKTTLFLNVMAFFLNSCLQYSPVQPLPIEIVTLMPLQLLHFLLSPFIYFEYYSWYQLTVFTMMIMMIPRLGWIPLLGTCVAADQRVSGFTECHALVRFGAVFAIIHSLQPLLERKNLSYDPSDRR